MRLRSSVCVRADDIVACAARCFVVVAYLWQLGLRCVALRCVRDERHSGSTRSAAALAVLLASERASEVEVEVKGVDEVVVGGVKETECEAGVW